MKNKKLNIVYEDKYLLIVNKRSGLLTISTVKEKEKTLYHEVRSFLNKKNQKAFIVNRLDKDTSGLVVFAKNEKVKSVLQNNWDKVIRKYYAVVAGVTDSKGEIKEYLTDTKTLYTHKTNKTSGKLALTLYKKVKSNNNYSLLDVEIKTGRKNQIRVGFKDINHPIIGDKKYGIIKSPINEMCLFAYFISFIHPITKKEIIINLDMPKKYLSMFN